MPADPQSPRYRFGLFELDGATRELRRNGTKLKLQDQPMQVLLTLVERPQEIISREELRQKLWPSDTFVDFDHSLNTAINKLRETLGDTAANPRFVETLPRRGYRFVAPVTTDQPAATAPATQAAPEPTPHVDDIPLPPRRITRFLYGALQLMYLVFYCLALWRLAIASSRSDELWHIPALWTEAAIVITGVLGIPLRLYTLAATIFDYRLFAEKHRLLFPLLLVLDFLWALSPLLLVPDIGIGLAIAACAALFYSPFAQRMLVRMAWSSDTHHTLQ
jgi:DNA-binding winged helix-turn-helix (wHTH) protein